MTAREMGLRTYSGSPCSRGHRERYVTNMKCERCSRETLDRWINEDPKRKVATIARWKAASRNPSWADQEAIKAFYAACPPGYEVDHKIPLKGKNVCGLHIVENLQYLPMRENRAKGNR